MLQRWTGQNGLWWLWHLSATGLLVTIVVYMAAGLALQRQQLAATQAQTAALQAALQAQQEIKHTVTLISNNVGHFPKHSACASLFLVGITVGGDPAELFKQVTGLDASMCGEP